MADKTQCRINGHHSMYITAAGIKVCAYCGLGEVAINKQQRDEPAVMPRDKQAVEPFYPVPQGSRTKLFGNTFVTWHIGDDPNRWKGSAVHWLESGAFKRPPVGYDFVARLTMGHATFVGFTAYYDGDLPIEQPLMLQKGK